MAAVCTFKNFTFLTVGTVKSAEIRHCAKFCRNRSNRGRDFLSRFFDFLKWRPPLSWILNIKKNLTVGHAKNVELLHCAKFWLNRSNRGRDMVIFLISQDGRNGQGGRTAILCQIK